MGYKEPNLDSWSGSKILAWMDFLRRGIIARQQSNRLLPLKPEEFVGIHTLPECRVVSVQTGRSAPSGWSDSDGYEVSASLLVLRCQTCGVNSSTFEHVWELNGPGNEELLTRFPLSSS